MQLSLCVKRHERYESFYNRSYMSSNIPASAPSFLLRRPMQPLCANLRAAEAEVLLWKFSSVKCSVALFMHSSIHSTGATSNKPRRGGELTWPMAISGLGTLDPLLHRYGSGLWGMRSLSMRP
jgi:hypothetical protein